MEIRPILAALTRHKLIATLLALLVALTCAIVCNVAFMIQQRAQRMDVRSGVAENQLVMIASASLDKGENQRVRHQTDLVALRDIPGVKDAAAVNALPFNGNDWMNSIATAPNGPSPEIIASVFYGTPGELKTLGLHLVSGRDFQRGEYVPLDGAHGGLQHVSAAIVTRAVAARLFPGENPLGKLIYSYPNPIRIVGVVARLVQPDTGSAGHPDYSVLLPMLPNSREVVYALRTAPADRARVLARAKAVLYRLDPDRVVIHARTFTQLRARYFRGDRTMIGLLIASALGLLLVAALGIAGLASFWVQQRTRSIGIRRALGATRRDILRYFQTENFLIVTGGVILGVLLAIGLNLLLMHFYELPRLPLWYLAVGAVALWILGQLAVLAPALRAARVPPVVATRSV